MLLLNQLNDKANQKLSIATEDGNVFELTLKYLPTQQGWVFDLSFEDFQVYNLNLVCSLNCIRQFKNRLPFGIYCTTNDGGDPQNIDDFLKERIKIFVLTEQEVQSIEDTYYTYNG